MTPRLRGTLRDVIVVVVISLVTFALHHAGLLDRFETAGLDAFNVLNPARDPSGIVVIGIQDQDYADPQLFNGTSPLRCETVRAILDAIAAGRPAAIGVDLDTSSGDFSCLAPPVGASWPPIVWAQDAIWDPAARHFQPQPALRGVPAARGPRDVTGLAVFPQDGDGVIRRYRRELPLADGSQRASFPWAVVTTACQAGCERCCAAAGRYRTDSHAEPLRLNFAGERFNFSPLSVRVVLAAAGADPTGGGWRERGPLVGQIVLLGGSYRAARDSHATPVGAMSGVQIMAQAIESELTGGGIRSVNEWVALGLDVALGLLLVWIHHRLRHRVTMALGISLGVMPILCLIASYIAFSTLGLWFNFAAVMTSILIDQLYRRATETAH
jgi:CHASE2 domain-containing sensor protein